jgi:hypothetical protein
MEESYRRERLLRPCRQRPRRRRAAQFAKAVAVQSQTWMRGLYQRYPSQTGSPRVQ